VHGEDGARVALGRIYVAPPDHHMTIRADGSIGLNRGLKEHFTRPAADPLFRSTARAYGPRVVGIVLTGGGRDGTAGLTAIEKCGGLTIVEEPNEACDPGMPANAIEFDKPTLRLPLGQISGAIVGAASSARAET
jgi:two-component system chemotaxis response regulator CheB